MTVVEVDDILNSGLVDAALIDDLDSVTCMQSCHTELCLRKAAFLTGETYNDILGLPRLNIEHLLLVQADGFRTNSL